MGQMQPIHSRGQESEERHRRLCKTGERTIAHMGHQMQQCSIIMAQIEGLHNLLSSVEARHNDLHAIKKGLQKMNGSLETEMTDGSKQPN